MPVRMPVVISTEKTQQSWTWGLKAVGFFAKYSGPYPPLVERSPRSCRWAGLLPKFISVYERLVAARCVTFDGPQP